MHVLFDQLLAVQLSLILYLSPQPFFGLHSVLSSDFTFTSPLVTVKRRPWLCNMSNNTFSNRNAKMDPLSRLRLPFPVPF